MKNKFVTSLFWIVGWITVIIGIIVVTIILEVIFPGYIKCVAYIGNWYLLILPFKYMYKLLKGDENERT